MSIPHSRLQARPGEENAFAGQAAAGHASDRDCPSAHPGPTQARVRKNVSLRALNTFGVDACATTLLDIHQAEELADLPDAFRSTEPGQRPIILGGGSNILFTRDPPRPILRMAIGGRRVIGPTIGTNAGEAVLVEAGAGENWSDFVDWTLAHGLAGLENLSLIPGTVGASPIQNIGAYGVEMCRRFDSLEAVSLRDGQHRRFDASECRFAYRDSIFRHAAGRDWVIVAVRFRLRHDMPLELDYGALREELRERGCARPTAQDVARAVTAIRRRKLPDPAVLGNAGSFFRNPIVDAQLARSLIERHPQMPFYNAGSAGVAAAGDHPAVQNVGPSAGHDAGHPSAGAVKLSAAWLIEQCGWKGFRAGDAGVHDRHALILVNHGSATGAEIAALAARIADSVQMRFAVRLEPEPDIL